MRYVLTLVLFSTVTLSSFGQNGTLESQTPIAISKTDLWGIISQNDSVRPDYTYANQLNYAEITYKSDSLSINGLLIAPKAKGNYPVIIYNRGGNRDFNELTLKMLFFSTAILANEGYIILASNYRDQDEYGGRDLNDVLNLIHVAAQIENADTSKIGMFGWSRGGMMTYLALKESERIKTAVIGNGAPDLFHSIKNRPELEANVLSECIPHYWDNKTAELTKRSALFWADSLNKKSSLLLLCGTLDAQVDYRQSVKMASKLDSINYDYELKMYETNHGFRGKRNELNSELIHWFNTRLKGSSNANNRKIAITIDDVPNTISYQKNDFTAGLLNVLDSLDVPFTIFINENKIYKTEFLDKNKDLLKKWIENDQAIIGNHTYSHSRYSAVGFDDFVKDIELGEALTNEYASEKNKEVTYFRFPFNDMGKDSIQHMQMREYLTSKGYITAPFTVESSDWMFDVIYRHYLESGQTEKANEIGKLYVNKTLELIAFFEAMSDSIYHRPVKQIYLCHDNAINTRYLAEIIERLQKENYEIVSLDESMTDDVYRQEDRYYKKWGISWLYRWMSTQQERVEWMNQEPDLTEVEKTYNEIVNKE